MGHRLHHSVLAGLGKSQGLRKRTVREAPLVGRKGHYSHPRLRTKQIADQLLRAPWIRLVQEPSRRPPDGP
eukprot:5717939-Alexandrium_andersonii.AAC.1